MLRFSAIAFAAASIASAAPLYRRSTFTDCLENSGLDPITSSTNYDSYSSLTAAFNQRFQPDPVAVVTPSDANGVAAAVSCARQSSVPVSARGGGHSYAAYGVGQGEQGLVIYLNNFANIDLQSDNRTVVIGGGNTLGNVALQLDSWGLALAHGVCPFVGIGGHAAYGGFGYASRAWGLTLDAVTAYDVVLANGTVVEGLTRDQDPDLFWALAGAAPNFGIVTAYHFLAQPKPDNAVNFKYSYSGLSPETMTQAFLAYQSFGQTSAPPQLGISFTIGTGGSLDISGVFYGTMDEYNTALSPLLNAIPDGTSFTAESLSWIDSLQKLAGNQALSTTNQQDSRDSFFAKSLMTPDSDQLISSDAANAFFSYLQNTPTDTNWFVEMNLYGGAGSAINSVSLDQSSFSQRSSLLTMQMYASSSTYGNPYPDTGVSYVQGMYDALVNPMKDVWSESSGYGAYTNYVDPTLSQDEVKTLYWGSQYDRLSQLRAKYDNDQVFKNPQSIVPASSS